ncbi:hypothetical protein BpHYR1_044143 [Brachionus plicatilis]|uniref:Uncharacterized protein n=1 Tax=Brachionus plicatilis TaxID=10195 RepID=A0A3M7SJX9_BRAPC|nr:hypothetical protein BpHYR1_044143 [Brachionus plicatilis]
MSSVDETLLDIFKQLRTYTLKSRQIVALGLHVIHQDFGLENAAQLGQSFNVNNIKLTQIKHLFY